MIKDHHLLIRISTPQIGESRSKKRAASGLASGNQSKSRIDMHVDTPKKNAKEAPSNF